MANRRTVALILQGGETECQHRKTFFLFLPRRFLPCLFHALRFQEEEEEEERRLQKASANISLLTSYSFLEIASCARVSSLAFYSLLLPSLSKAIKKDFLSLSLARASEIFCQLVTTKERRGGKKMHTKEVSKCQGLRHLFLLRLFPTYRR